jgi:hypothetical protein
MGAPRQVEQLHSFKRVSDIPRHLFARKCCARLMGIQEISTYTSMIVCIPTVVARFIAILPGYSKSDKIIQTFQELQCFHSKRGQEQGLGKAFATCSFHATSGKAMADDLNELTKDTSGFKHQSCS